jgi:hypothetical protein
MNDEVIHARIRCDHKGCTKEPREWSGELKSYQVGLMAIWFHSSHEGHMFSYWEGGRLLLGSGDAQDASC